jgi:hypothetical protein
MAEAFCFKCRAKRQITNETKVTLKNGRPAVQGTCPVCGTKVFRIGSGAKGAAAKGSSAKR